MLDKSFLCMLHPPTSREYFSTMRKPGVVFLVPATVPFHPASFAMEEAALAYKKGK
jgi:hypothetical protein